MTAEIVYYAFFLLLGMIVSFEDWKEKKIRNRWIFIGMIACAAGLSWFMGNSLLGYRHLHFLGLGASYYPWHYYPRVLLHLFLSLTAAVVLWRLAIWPAGDAKFYTLLSFFAVLIDPNLPGFPQVLFLLLLVNIFVPAGLLFAGETGLRLLSRLPKLREFDRTSWMLGQLDRLRVRGRELWPYRYDYLVLTVNLFAVFFLLQRELPRLGRYVSGPWGALLVFAAMSFAWKGLSAVLRNKLVGLLALASLSAWMLTGSLLWHWNIGAFLVEALKMTAKFWVFLSLGRGLFTWIIERESLRDSPLDQLRHGVVLSDESWHRIGSEEELSDEMGERYIDGISEEDAVTLRSWLESKGVSNFSVYQTIPFALWIFFGTLLTVSRGCNVVAVLVSRFWWAQQIFKSAASRWPS